MDNYFVNPVKSSINCTQHIPHPIHLSRLWKCYNPSAFW